MNLQDAIEWQERLRKAAEERRHWRIHCYYCGKKKGCEQAHYLASPDCWEKDQERRKNSKGARSILRQCWDCERMFKGMVTKRYCIYCLRKRKADRQRERREAEKIKNAVCETCNKGFTPKRKGSVYCSPACRQKAYRQRYGSRIVAPAHLFDNRNVTDTELSFRAETFRQFNNRNAPLME